MNYLVDSSQEGTHQENSSEEKVTYGCWYEGYCYEEGSSKESIYNKDSESDEAQKDSDKEEGSQKAIS